MVLFRLSVSGLVEHGVQYAGKKYWRKIIPCHVSVVHVWLFLIQYAWLVAFCPIRKMKRWFQFRANAPDVVQCTCGEILCGLNQDATRIKTLKLVVGMKMKNT